MLAKRHKAAAAEQVAGHSESESQCDQRSCEIAMACCVDTEQA